MDKQTEVPQGYKKTEVGVIPEDWSFEKIGDKIELLTGFPFPSSMYAKVGIRLLKGANIKRGETDWSEEITNFWDNSLSVYRQYELKVGDLVIAMDGSLVGRSYALLATSDLPAILLQRVARIRSEKIIIEYLKHHIGSSWFVQYMDSVKTVTAIPHISPKDIRQFQIPLPPTLTEQRAIATALSDADDLIAALDRLIAKKKAIKQGVMQELLTGKRRLPSFADASARTARYKETEAGVLPEDWEACVLSEIIWFQEGPGLRNWQFRNKGLKVINVTNLQEYGYLDLDKTDRHISIEEFEKMYKHFLIDDGDVVMASSGNSYCKTSVVRKRDLPLLMNTSVIRFKPLGGLDYYFMLIYLKSHFFKNQIDFLITGGAQPNFGPAHLRKIIIPLPKNQNEQRAIAQIFTDMDTEIESLERKRDKYRAIKQGMMQELLTGKTRLMGSKEDRTTD